MEFGLFNSACVLPQFSGDEHRRILDEVAIVQAAERVGFKYTWVTEHHFLTQYSHLSANEVFLGYLFGAGLMVGAALVELAIGVRAERQPLESVARPLSFVE